MSKQGEELVVEALGHHFSLDPLLASDLRKLKKKRALLSNEETIDIALEYRDKLLDMNHIQKLAWNMEKEEQRRRRERLRFLAFIKKSKRQVRKLREELEKE